MNLIVKTETCWLWIGNKTNTGTKYGRYKGKPAHRVVWEFLKGKIPDKLEIDHLCRITLCVNPEHLEPVTKSENMKRLHEFQRNRKC